MHPEDPCVRAGSAAILICHHQSNLQIRPPNRSRALMAALLSRWEI
jgi:hypothetical protein